jgi:CDP-paratose 2-epimerase
VGGGIKQSVSVIEMLQRIERQTGQPFTCAYNALRPGDQPLYITDFNKLTRATGWRPTRSVEQTLADIHTFWKANHRLILQQRETATGEQDDLVGEEVA